MSTDPRSLNERFADRCREDGEFRLAARHWDGSLRFDLGSAVVELEVRAGDPAAAAWRAGPGALAFRAPAEVWAKILQPIPPPRFNDIAPAAAFGLVRDGADETYWQYYPAVRRAVDLLREEWNRGQV